MHDGSKATVPPVFTMFHHHQVEICKTMFGVNAQSSVRAKKKNFAHQYATFATLSMLA